MSKEIDKQKEYHANKIMEHNGYVSDKKGEIVKDKCEWKAVQEGNKPATWKFEPCKKFNGYVTTDSLGECKCANCRADIRKPEPAGCKVYNCKIYNNEPAEPLIVKSGETYVAYWEGVDYLMNDKWDSKPPFCIHNAGIETSWKSFTGPNPNIKKLTDEIAKLRPMITGIDMYLIGFAVLYGVWENQIAIVRRMPIPLSSIRLATAHELQEASNEH